MVFHWGLCDRKSPSSQLPLSLPTNPVVFFNILPEQKFVIVCRVENSLMQNTGLLHELNFGSAQPPLRQGVYVCHSLLYRQNTKRSLFDGRVWSFSLTATSSSLCLSLSLFFQYSGKIEVFVYLFTFIHFHSIVRRNYKIHETKILFLLINQQ